MSTIEKLFVQIFERRNWIIDQVKHQTHLYDQHLASKLLIHGLQPPSWLWTSDLKELKKEELISELLHPHPRTIISHSTGDGSLYRDPVLSAYNGKPPEGILTEPNDSKKGCEAVPQYHFNNNGIVSNRDAELDLMPTPQDRTDAREIYSDPSQSLARIQRSKSRQRAIELRNSAKTKNVESKTNISAGITRSRSASQQPHCQQPDCRNKVSASLNSSDFNESEEVNEANVEYFQSRGEYKSIYSGSRSASSESSYQQPTQMNKSSELENSDIANDDLQTGSDTALQNVLGFETILENSESKQKILELFEAKGTELDNHDIANDDLKTGADTVFQNLLGFETILENSESKQTHIELSEAKVTEIDNHENGPPCSGTVDIVDHERFSSHKGGPEVKESILPSDCGMVVKPMQLDFDNLEECGLIKALNPASDSEKRDRSFRKRHFTPLEQEDKNEKVAAALKKSLVGEHEILRKEMDNHEKERVVNERKVSDVAASWPQYKRRKIECQQSDGFSSPKNFRVKPFHNIVQDTPTRWSVEDTPERVSPSQQLSNLHDVEIIRSDINKSLEIEWQQEVLQGHVIAGSEFSPQFQGDKDGNTTQGRDDFTNFPFTIRELQVVNNENNFHLQSNLNMGIPEEGCLLSSYSSGGSMIGVDQAMPVLEGFIIDGVRENLVFDESALPNSTLERASILEHLCKSAILQTPSIHLSSTCKLHRTLLYQSVDSVPNGTLEHIQKNSNCISKDLTSSSLEKSYSDSLWNIRKPLSPVGKVCDGSASKSVESMKRGLNSELTCFPIEEDLVIDEENGEVEEVGDTSESLVDSPVKGEREPLVDITAKCTNLKASACEARVSFDRGSLDSVNTDISFTGKKPKHGTRGWTDEAKENHYSMGGNVVKMATESFDNRFSKPIPSGKNSSRGGERSMSEKESKSNNIVSNMNSFLPLVQQKQGAAAVTGKRDVKVKALEVAEVTKRLEEKRENERKIKKEALKLQRAEKKRKKEDERKKREVEVAAKKRAKEEEERKRKRIEEACRDSEEKLLGEKEARDFEFRATDGIAKHQIVEEGSGEDLTVQFYEALSDCLDVKKVTKNLDKATEDYDSFSTMVREESYAISPYQGSEDEEDEEEDEISNTKFVPSWASKHSVAILLSSVQKIDPYKIFPLESFSSIGEVLLPRKQQLNR